MLIGVTATYAQRRRKPKPAGVPSEIEVTPYKTTMIANGDDKAYTIFNIKDRVNMIDHPWRKLTKTKANLEGALALLKK